MSNTRTIALVLLIPFLGLTVYAISQVGYVGIIDYQRYSPAGWQVLADLVIAIVLILLWLIPNAKATGRNPWPYVALSIFLGSIGPLIYLALGSNTRHQR